ncbi:hypothetical protein ACE1ET_02610 [Saccharicrinis sp. FJH62]|uniref:hypothetical protein n=1 Tax=Saccharicrinis sp. FJH62 TaxID=3344657 RepID=UPI0035D4F8FE
MQKKGIIVFIVLLVVALIAIIVADVIKTRTDNRPDNPYALEYDDLKNVDPNLISHKETKNFRLTGDSLGAMTIDSAFIYVSVDRNILVLDLNGVIKQAIPVTETAKSLALCPDQNLIVGYKDYIEKIDCKGIVLAKTEPVNDKSVITNVAVYNNRILYADAGNREIFEVDKDLKPVNSFEGKREEGALHGFIVPSANFDLAFTNSGELWVVNPGLHAIENYDASGKMRSYWEATSFKLGGFSGCCNPARIAIMNDDSFVTSEKGIVRIKIHGPSGKFVSVVAPPSKFKVDGKAPDVAVNKEGVVYALDYDKKMIRVFEPVK